MQEWKGYSGDEGVRRCGAPSRVDVSLNNPTTQVVFFVHKWYSLYTGVFFVHRGILCIQGYSLYTGVCFVHGGMLCTQGYALYTGVCFIHRGMLCTPGLVSFLHNLYFLYFVLLMSVVECSKEWMVSVVCVLECHLPARATGRSLLVHCQLLYCPPWMDSGLRVRNASANGALGMGSCLTIT